MRFIHILFLLLLLVLLVCSTVLYLYVQSPSFQDFIETELNIVRPIFSWTLQTLHEYNGRPWWGIALTFALFALYLFVNYLLHLVRIHRGEKARRAGNSAAYFTLALLATLGLGLWSIVYFWAEDTIRIGNFIKIVRGPREVFLDESVHIALLVLIAHLFLFLLTGLYRCVFFSGRKPQKKESA